MRHETLWSLISLLSSPPLRLLYLLVLTDQWRLPPRKRRPLMAALIAAVAAAQLICFQVLGTDAQVQIGMLGVIFSHLVFFAMIPWRRGRGLFILLTTISLSSVCSTIVTLLSISHGAVRLAVKLTLNLLLLLILYHLFRPGFHRVLQIDISLWYWLSLIPSFFVLIFYVLRFLLSLHELSALIPPLLLLLYALIGYTYIGFFLIFRALNAQYEAGRSDVLHNAHFRQAEAARRDAARVHELNTNLARFREQTSALLKSGDHTSALALVAGMDTQLTLPLSKKHCFTAEPLLNAVLSYYAEWAETAGVSLSIQFQLSPHFEVDRASLAVVLSNALENAMHACLSLPPERPRSISLTLRSTLQQFFLSITNTCQGPVKLDSATGLPGTQRQGHGYGIKSITAFTTEYNGILRCKTDCDSFCLEMML
ncbi:MAG: GHKL domain-containing protein [Eubacteriales bacterium]|nr:GHKL domain-containing protein [Eubacteriales bacterium]